MRESVCESVIIVLVIAFPEDGGWSEDGVLSEAVGVVGGRSMYGVFGFLFIVFAFDLGDGGEGMSSPQSSSSTVITFFGTAASFIRLVRMTNS